MAVKARPAFGAGHRELPQGWVHHVPAETSVVGGSCTELAVVGQPSVRTKFLAGVRNNRLVSDKLRALSGTDDTRTYRYVVHASIQVLKS